MVMTLFEIVNELYTNKSIHWIYELEDNEIDVFMIQRFLSMNLFIANKVSYLSGFTKNPDKKQYLALAWAIIPKQEKAPFTPFIKPESKIDDIYQPILDKIQKLLRLTHNDIVDETKYYITEIEKDKAGWFRRLGMERVVWLKHGLDFEEMRGGEQRDVKVGLEVFGL